MKQEWITDRLPECEEEVLICYKYTNRDKVHTILEAGRTKIVGER